MLLTWLLRIFFSERDQELFIAIDGISSKWMYLHVFATSLSWMNLQKLKLGISDMMM